MTSAPLHRGWGTLVVVARFTRKHAGIDAASVDAGVDAGVSGAINAASAAAEFGATPRHRSRRSKSRLRPTMAMIL
jgi:hypothetical protein